MPWPLPITADGARNVLVEQMLEPGKRVTIAMGTNRDITTACKRKIVSPSSPRDEMELYWGYKVRYASNLGGVFSDSPYKEGYDYIIGTSEHGKIISSSELILPSFRVAAFGALAPFNCIGGLAGLEECIEEDRNLKGKGVDDVFNTYLNTCPSQGSRTIRTEGFVPILTEANVFRKHFSSLSNTSKTPLGELDSKCGNSCKLNN
ncbi:hypothetical protein OsI_15078 [Oryza sativa Indica Group]|uniref:Uncharacterized protein n=1 Tax=Oryza sativa subsp. indica TaxID=39946 RepID=A2XR10_ORYSI|nr:hypothetical protein OsI_15078 [Oryza sativa Indica Group]